MEKFRGQTIINEAYAINWIVTKKPGFIPELLILPCL